MIEIKNALQRGQKGDRRLHEMETDPGITRKAVVYLCRERENKETRCTSARDLQTDHVGLIRTIHTAIDSLPYWYTWTLP